MAEKQGGLKKKIQTLLKLVLTGLALYLVFRKIDTGELLELLKAANFIWFVPAILLFVFSKVATAFRLNLYFRNIGLVISELQNWKLYLIGMFYNLFLPGGIGGDGYKVYLLHKEYQTPVKKLIQAALLDRLGGLISIVFLMFGFFLLVDIAIPWMESNWWNGLMVAGIVLTFPAFWLMQKLMFKDFMPSFWPAMLWSFAGQIAQLFCVWFILLALGIEQQIMAYQLVFLLSSIVSILPLTIGGVGARELVFVYAHTYAGIDEAAAVAFSMIFFVITALVSLCGAFIKVDFSEQKAV